MTAPNERMDATGLVFLPAGGSAGARAADRTDGQV